MKIEIMIYFYIAVCVSMIVYNCVYVFILHHREKSIDKNSEKLKSVVENQFKSIESGGKISEEHEKYIFKKLSKIWGVTAFDKALEALGAAQKETAEEYLTQICPVFLTLAEKYKSKDTIQSAYFPYILHKYNMISRDESGQIKKTLFELLRSKNIYCRENTLKAIYSSENPFLVADALMVIDKNKSFHHAKLICDGLLAFKGDRELLNKKLLEKFELYSVKMQVSILNFFRFGNVRCDEEMLEFLTNEKYNQEIHFSAIRYFEKFPHNKACAFIQGYAENKEGKSWEYMAIATSALKAYPDAVTKRILINNLSDSNWHVRYNSAVSCERIGYSYNDLINVFDGNDRYAREILRYRMDRRKSEELTVKL